MPKWNSPFEEVYYQALQDGANDISEQAKLILADAGLDTQQVQILTDKFKEMAETVQERHSYGKNTAVNLPNAPARTSTGPWRT